MLLAKRWWWVSLQWIRIVVCYSGETMTEGIESFRCWTKRFSFSLSKHTLTGEYHKTIKTIASYILKVFTLNSVFWCCIDSHFLSFSIFLCRFFSLSLHALFRASFFIPTRSKMKTMPNGGWATTINSALFFFGRVGFYKYEQTT